MRKYQLTVEADSLAELTGAVTEAAVLLQAGDTAELMTLAEAPAPALPNGAEQPPLPTPPPDYAAAGLTDWQAIRARAAGAAATAPAPVAVSAVPAAALNAAGKPFCPIHQAEMVWKGGGLSKAGKGLPLWSCPDRSCREAIWP